VTHVRAKKIQVDEACVQLLRTMRSRTGLTHQYLCRIAFCLSLTEPGAPDPDAYDEKGTEFNRYTLTGEYDDLFVAYLREWLSDQPNAESYDEADWFRAHINRGLQVLPRRVRVLADISDLVAA
jgi:DNA sulfur modification protein DndE